MGEGAVAVGGGTQVEETTPTGERTENIQRDEFLHAAHVHCFNRVREARTWARDVTSLLNTKGV